MAAFLRLVPRIEAAIYMKPLVVFDLETTGLDRTKDQIIQFAAIKINRETNEILDSKNLYIQPEGNYQISIQAYMKHGIKADFLKDKPHFIDVAQEIFDFFNDIIETLNNSVEIEGIIDVDEKLIKDICNYCETQAIYDKLGRYGDFYYKFVRYFWI